MNTTAINARLAGCQGDAALVYLWSPTFRRMLIQVYRGDGRGAIYLFASGCSEMRGPFSWRVGRLELSEAPDRMTRIVADNSVGFELLCSSLFVTPHITQPISAFEQMAQLADLGTD